MANTDRFGNLVDENGHDILEDEEELADLDEVRAFEEDDDFDLEDEYADDFPFECEYEADADWFVLESDLANEY